MGQKFNFSTFPGVHANTRYRLPNSVVKRIRLAPAGKRSVCFVAQNPKNTHTKNQLCFCNFTPKNKRGTFREEGVELLGVKKKEVVCRSPGGVKLSSLMHFPFVSGVSVRATLAGHSDGIQHKFFLHLFRLTVLEKTGGAGLDKRRRRVVKVEAEVSAAAPPRVFSSAIQRVKGRNKLA